MSDNLRYYLIYAMRWSRCNDEAVAAYFADLKDYTWDLLTLQDRELADDFMKLLDEEI